MQYRLNPIEIRVLGSLIEKSLATPDNYPLSLNALINACNQKSNRNPVVSYDESSVREAIISLEEKNLATKSHLGRVIKYEETLSRQANFIAEEVAVLAVLLLRGAQTAGAIRSRTARMCQFKNLADVLETLERLAEWGYVKQLIRLPGHKESRWIHLFDEEGQGAEPDESETLADTAEKDGDRVDQLAEEVAALREEIEQLKDAFETFKAQFE